MRYFGKRIAAVAVPVFLANMPAMAATYQLTYDFTARDRLIAHVACVLRPDGDTVGVTGASDFTIISGNTAYPVFSNAPFCDVYTSGRSLLPRLSLKVAGPVDIFLSGETFLTPGLTVLIGVRLTSVGRPEQLVFDLNFCLADGRSVDPDKYALVDTTTAPVPLPAPGVLRGGTLGALLLG